MNQNTVLKFTKMHGLGNDFVVLDGVTQNVHLSPERVRYIADRRFGIGCDQVLLVEPPQHANMDFRYRIFNADGSEVEQCGNGARCFARFVTQKRLTHKRIIHVETMNAQIQLHLENDNTVKVDMGKPNLIPDQIPFVAPQLQLSYPLTVTVNKQEHHITLGTVSMGNPHGVLCIADVNEVDVAGLGAALSHHPSFPKQANIGFMQILSRHHIKLRVYERGAGETLACGTGACAAVVLGVEKDLLQGPVQVDLPGGSLSINYKKSQNGHYSHVFMSGPATWVYEGKIRL
ncbi:MAG TPA: diaminopimelate epimerase [Pseudomonadales bacterium]|nr:diaminopimelate epimerase [Pseudomonadales bacterium]